jgi:hypothetical protein
MRYIALLAILILSGCSAFSKGDTDFTCPKTGLVEDASTVTVLAENGISAEAVIAGFSGDCVVKDKQAVVTLALPFVVKKGPAGAALGAQKLSYFIAVLSPEEKVLQRQAFGTRVVFDDTGSGSGTEEHVIKIPLMEPGTAYKYKVVIGFTLSPDQLAYNRKRK